MVLLSKNIKLYRPYLISIVFILLVSALVLLILIKRDSYQVKAGTCLFKAEAAITATEQYQGLSNRKQLKTDEGMIFIFDTPADKTFVMRNMLFPLDIIFIRDQQVINLYQNLPPEGASTTMSYHSGAPVDAVLEIPGGRSRACGIGVGTQVNW